jgi:hypothetical protein
MMRENLNLILKKKAKKKKILKVGLSSLMLVMIMTGIGLYLEACMKISVDL